MRKMTNENFIEDEKTYFANQFIPGKNLNLDNNSIIRTNVRPQIKNLDDLPIIDRSLVNYDKYVCYIGQAEAKYTMAVQATKGCPYECIYCDIQPKVHYRRSVENIFDEVKVLHDIGVKRIVIIDDIFNVHIKHCISFFQLVLKNKLDLQFFFPNGLKGDLLTEEIMDLMVEAGTISVNMSLETASPRLQEMIKKGLDIDSLHKNIQYFTKNHPSVVIGLNTMHGFPTETEEEALMTLDFIKSINWLHFPYVHTVRAFPGTPMYQLAIDHGVAQEAIEKSVDMGYHETSPTLPFSKTFSFQYKMSFMRDYFLNKKRLLQVLPHQMKLFDEDEMVQKYNAYFPTKFKTINDLLLLANIDPSELGSKEFVDESKIMIPDLALKISKKFPETNDKKGRDGALRLLLLDLSTSFSNEKENVYDVLEPPQGLMALLTYVNEVFGDKVEGTIYKSRIDFDSYEELYVKVKDFAPDIIGIRSLSFYRIFFHKAISYLRNKGITTSIITGGPYATSSFSELLHDRNIDLVVLGEGELTLGEILKHTLVNNNRLPDVETLRSIDGIAFFNEKTADATIQADGDTPTYLN